MRDEDVVRRHESELIGLCKEAARGGITRRQFMEQALVLGLSTSAVGTLAAACGSSGDGGTAADTNTLPPMDETKPSQITFYNWTDYIDPAIKKDFQKAEGITVKEVYFSSNEEMLAKMRAGAKGYDVIVPSDYMVHIMIKSKLLEPLDLKVIPNYANVDAQFQKPTYDNPDQNGGLQYSVPYFYGTTGYCAAHRQDHRAADGLGNALGHAVQGPDQHARRRARGSGRRAEAARLLAELHGPGELDQATQKLIDQKPLVAVYDSTNMKRAMVQGQPLVMCWDGDALMGIDALGGDAEAKKLILFVRPSEGYTLWTDNLVCPVGNNSRYGAHLWMNYLLDPKVEGKNASWVWYLAPETASHQYTDKFALSLMPTADELSRSEVIDDVGEFATAYSDAWRQVKSA